MSKPRGSGRRVWLSGVRLGMRTDSDGRGRGQKSEQPCVDRAARVTALQLANESRESMALLSVQSARDVRMNECDAAGRRGLSRGGGREPKRVPWLRSSCGV